MNLNSDLIDLLHALNGAGAEYVIVGGYAFAFHGRIRAKTSISSSERPRMPIDGVDFNRARANRQDATYGAVRVHFIGRADLIANKEAAGTVSVDWRSVAMGGSSREHEPPACIEQEFDWVDRKSARARYLNATPLARAHD